MTPFLFSSNQVLFDNGKWEEDVEPVIHLLRNDEHHISFRVTVPGVLTGVKSSHGRLFSTLDLPSAGWTNKIGKPRLPVIRRIIEIPQHARVTVKVETIDNQVVSLQKLNCGYELFPVQLPVEKLPSGRGIKPFQKDAGLYLSDLFYPESAVTISPPRDVRGRRLVTVEFSPLRYNPSRQKIHVATDSIIHLELHGGDSALSDSQAWTKYSLKFEKHFSRNILNYRAWNLSKSLSTMKYAEGILVVVGDAYADNVLLAEYIEMRRDEGHRVEKATVSEIGGDTDEAVRAYIQTQYAEWQDPALSYVVLVGDVDDVPVHQGVMGFGGGQATDLYYASISDAYLTDLLAPDLFVSRISVNTVEELETYLTRARRYLLADYDQPAWMEKLSFLASCDNYYISEGTHNYVIDTYTTDMGYTGTFPEDPQPGGDLLYCHQGLSGNDIAAALSDGRVIINFSGHGGTTYWADPFFGDLAEVTHPDAAPFVISNACVTGSFGRTSGDCWGERWLAHTSGAILFLGASNNSFWDEDDIMEKRMWDGIYADGITRLGDIVRNAKEQLLAHYGTTMSIRYYYEMYNMLGDATLDLYTHAPQPLDIYCPSEIFIGTDIMEATVSDAGGPVENALVCLRGGAVQQVGYTDVDGRVILCLDPPPETTLPLKLTVTAHDRERFEQTISIIENASLLYFPRLSFAPGLSNEGFGFVNPGQDAAHVSFTAYDGEGHKAGFSGDLMEWPAGCQGAYQADGILGLTQTTKSWVLARSDQPGLLGFFLSQRMEGQVLSGMDGAGFFTDTPAGGIIPRVRGTGDYTTEIFIANPGEEALDVSVTGYDGNTARTGGVHVIPAKGALMVDLDDLFGDKSAFDGSLLVEASGGVIGNATIRFGEKSLSSINLMPISEISETLYASHIVLFPDEYSTMINLVNNSNADTTATVHTYNADGTPMADPVDVVIPANQMTVLHDTDLGLPPDVSNEGWLKVESDGGILLGCVTFGDPLNGRYESTLPLQTYGGDDLYFAQVANGEVGGVTYSTGVAIVNPSPDTAVEVTITVFKSNGDINGNPVVRTLLPGEKYVRELKEIEGIGILENQSSGFLHITADGPVLSFELFYNNAMDFLSAVPAQFWQ